MHSLYQPGTPASFHVPVLILPCNLLDDYRQVSCPSVRWKQQSLPPKVDWLKGRIESHCTELRAVHTGASQPRMWLCHLCCKSCSVESKAPGRLLRCATWCWRERAEAHLPSRSSPERPRRVVWLRATRGGAGILGESSPPVATEGGVCNCVSESPKARRKLWMWMGNWMETPMGRWLVRWLLKTQVTFQRNSVIAAKPAVKT